MLITFSQLSSSLNANEFLFELLIGSEIAYSENRSNPRPLEGKRYRSKKRGCGKHTVPSAVRREICKCFFSYLIKYNT